MPKRWDLIQDSQGHIGLFAAWFDEDNLYLKAPAGVFHPALNCDPDMRFLFLCPEFKIIASLRGEPLVSPGNFYIQETGERELCLPVLRFDRHSWIEYRGKYLNGVEQKRREEKALKERKNAE